MLRRRTILAGLIALGSLTSCTSSLDTSELPDGHNLVTTAADKLRGLHSAHITLGVTGTLPSLPVHELHADMTRDRGQFGYATGKIDFDDHGERTESDFTLNGDAVTLTTKDGQPSQRPVPPCTPKTLFHPEHGLSGLLTSTTDVRTERAEQLDDVQTNRVSGTARQEALATLLPGVHSSGDVKFWIKQGTNELVKVWLQLPPVRPSEGAIMYELELSKLNEPVPTQ